MNLRPDGPKEFGSTCFCSFQDISSPFRSETHPFRHSYLHCFRVLRASKWDKLWSKKEYPTKQKFRRDPVFSPETMNFISEELCRLYVNSESGLCQGLVGLYKCQRLRRSRQKTARANKKQRRPLSCREWLTLFRKFAIICMIKDFQRICRYECSRFFG